MELGAKPEAVYTELGRLALKARDVTNANHYATKALTAREGFGPAMLLLGDIQMAIGSNQQAIRTFHDVWERTRSLDSCKALARAFAASDLTERAETQRRQCDSIQ